MTHSLNSQESGTPVRLGLVGLGYWGPNILRVLAGRTDVEVRWICDLDLARLAEIGRQHPRPRTTAEIDDLLSDAELDGILIATPIFTHFDLATRSLAAGKHTFVEKPLAGSAGDADKLIRQAEEAQLALMCGHTFLYSPPVRKVRELIDRGELGEIYFITSSRVNLGLHQSDVSVIWDLGPHDFSILRCWIDEAPISIAAVGRDAIVDGLADVAFITARFPSGTIANLEMSWLSPSKLRRTVVVGSKKMVVYEDGAAEPVRIFDHGVIYEDPTTFGEYHLSYRTGDILSPQVDSSEPLANEMDEFVSAIHAGCAPPGHAELCRDVVGMIEAAEVSLAKSGAPQSLVASGVDTLAR